MYMRERHTCIQTHIHTYTDTRYTQTYARVIKPEKNVHVDTSMNLLDMARHPSCCSSPSIILPIDCVYAFVAYRLCVCICMYVSMCMDMARHPSCCSSPSIILPIDCVCAFVCMCVCFMFFNSRGSEMMHVCMYVRSM